MLRRLSREHLAVVIFALARTIFCGYRAGHQSITIDEAYSYNLFLQGTWTTVYETYNAANHILFSILAKLCITLFGVSEFTLRLPTVAGGFFLVLGVYAILALTVSSPLIRWITLIGVSFHPLLLDFSVAARGYCLAVAFLMWAIYFAIRGGFERRSYGIATGVMLGLSVSANLVAAFPAAGLLACPFLLGDGDFERRLRAAVRIAVAAALTAAVICYPAMSEATTENFYLGLPTISLSLFSLVATSLRSRLDSMGWFGSDRGARIVQIYVLPMLAAFILAGAAKLLRHHLPRVTLVPLVTLTGALIALVLAHYFVGLGYPMDRMGLCLPPLLALSWAISTAQFPVSVRAINALLAVVLVVQMATQIEPDYFGIWVFNLPDKQIAKRIREATAGRPPQSVSVSTQWLHQTALEFYRQIYKIDAIKPVERREPTAYEGADYYVFDALHESAPPAVKRDYTELLKDPLTGVVLASEPVAR
jgi:hypothetical protein